MQMQSALKKLGIACGIKVANLKYDAQPLNCDETELARLRTLVNGRPIWVAASTHPRRRGAHRRSA